MQVRKRGVGALVAVLIALVLTLTGAAGASAALVVSVKPRVVSPGGSVTLTVKGAHQRRCRVTSSPSGFRAVRVRASKRFRIGSGASPGRVRLTIRCGPRVRRASFTIAKKSSTTPPSGNPTSDDGPIVGPGAQDVLPSQWVDCSIGCGGAQGNPFPYGQCTYHGYETRSDIYDYAVAHGQPRYGWDGYAWAGRASAVGFDVDTRPTAGALAVFSREYFGGPKADGGGGQYGHVGYVRSVNGDGSFVMSERNYMGNPNVTVHTYRVRAGIQFVHGLRGGPSPNPTYPSAPGSRDLYFAKTKNTGTGQVELHSATAGSGFQNGIHGVAWFSPADNSNGWFQTVGSDLFFIKTKNPGSGHVEVHSATAASGHQSGQHSVTWFSPGDADNGWFQMVGSDLFFIKTRNTGSGHVEVHSATAASGYQSGQHSVTWFSPADASNGWFQMVGSDLFFIKTRNTGSGHVEIHSAIAASGYANGEHTVTWFSPEDANNGWFQMAGSKG